MHFTSPTFARLLGCLVGALTLSVGSTALAQTITIVSGADNPSRNVETAGRSDSNRNAISYGDCLANDAFHFDLTVYGYSGYQLQIWAGSSASCTDYDARYGDAPECWLVYESRPTAENLEVTVRVQDIVASNKSDEQPSGPNSGTVADCDKASDGETVSLTFMLVNSNGEMVEGSSASWSTQYDLSGPAAPSGLSAGVAEGRLRLDWEIPSTISDVRGYRFYCVPVEPGLLDAGGAGAPAAPSNSGGSGATTAASGSAGDLVSAGSAGAAGSTSTGGLAASGTSGTSQSTAQAGASGEEGPPIDRECPNPVLFAGETPPSDPQYECGTASDTSNSGYTDEGLENNTVYAVGIAAYDDLGNVGPLSEVVCKAPMIVDDFYELYRREGGEGGGGFCSIGADPAPRVVLLFGACALTLYLRRRRRRRG